MSSLTHLAPAEDAPLGAGNGPVNVARRLVEMAARMPEALAVVVPRGQDRGGAWSYDRHTFRELDQDSDRIAAGLAALGVRPGTRLALLVRPSFEFVSLVFALFKAGAVQILIDPGMGRRNMIECLAAAEPEGFVAIAPAQAVRTILRRRFPKARHNVTVGRRWFWGGSTLAELRRRPWPGTQLADTRAHDPAAIIFTSGSTGVPKGVLYSQRNFDHQVTQIRDHYGIEPGEIDLPCFPLFALFNCAMGVTTVIPAMDASRPARVDPAKIVAAAQDWQVTHSFASPAVWNRVGPYCRERGIRLASLKRVFSAGAPVPTRVLATLRECLGPDATIHTPYGATESLPVASIEATEVLDQTAAVTAAGGGICVGRRFSEIEWRVLPIVDGPIASLANAVPLAPAAPGPAAILSGHVGELVVRGPVVTRSYVTRVEANAVGKIVDGDEVWHRLGDVGYLDNQERFWFCGRLSQRVVTPKGPLFTIPVEAIFNNHPRVFRSALVGVPAQQGPGLEPIVVVEPWSDQMPRDPAAESALRGELAELARSSPLSTEIREFLFHPAFPVDVRHNAKIFREQLAVWAAEQLGRRPSGRSGGVPLK